MAALTSPLPAVEAHRAYDWRDDALCAQVDGEIFFPELGASTRNAQRICDRCEVKDECLDYAMTTNQGFGVWGGLSEPERGRLKRGEPVETGSRVDDPVVVEQIAGLAGQGNGDAQIAAVLGSGWQASRVYELRRRHEIAAGQWQRPASERQAVSA